MKRELRAFGVTLALFGTIALMGTGCGGSSDASKMNYAAESAVDSYAGEEGLYSYGSGYEEEAYEEGADVKADEVSEEDASSNQSKRKLITNISMTVETREFDSLISFLKDKTDALGGYIESESINNNSYGTTTERYGHMVIRVPENKLDSFLSDVSDKSNILSQDRSVTDVTLTYADLDSHKKALMAEQEQLLALMERAETIEDIMSIQKQLTDVRYQIESMESQLRTYDNQVSYSTVNMSINEVIEYTPDAPPTFGERAVSGFMENLDAVKSFFVELALAVITHIPVLILLVVIVAVVLIIVRVIDKKVKKRKAERLKNAPQMMYQPGPMMQQPPVQMASAQETAAAESGTTDKTEE